MKRLMKWTFLLSVVFLLTACDWDDDGYSLNNYWVDFGLVQAGENGEDFRIAVDPGYAIIPINLHEINLEKYKNDVRVIVNYTIVGDRTVGEESEYYARINLLRTVLYKEPIDITPEVEDSIGNDPIDVKDVWTTKQMLNFELHYWGANQVHYINLVKQPGEITAEDLPLELELRHNANGDQNAYRMSAFVTFDLSQLQVEGRDSVNYIVRSTDYDGAEYTYEGVYKY
ncbi:NigD-like C-terminal domain-containing protein [Mangrovibacterium marinum]|uniref:NigD-like protein n=1 Tax=Mangrovibacterium marinum TaxID=1639118 RepID=A0A2T5BSY2_9BACT|nr:NigD-like C-terminal domain-containing protein [Mangrovibacterium marinum]PTN02419.1 NigD-like protein [Mangrovibacterium marinum]